MTERRTLTPLIRRYLRERRASGTYVAKSIRDVESRLLTLDVSFGSRPLERLSRRAIDRWLMTLGHLAPASRSAYLASVRTFTSWLTLERIISLDPCLGVPSIKRPRRVPRALNADQVRAVLAVCDDDRDRAMVWLEVGLGLRRGEVARARWEDYDVDRAVFLVTASKGGHERVVPVPTAVARNVAKVRARGTSGPIIRSKCGHGGVTPAWVGQRVSFLMRAAGVKEAPYDGKSGHALRHTTASDVLDECGDLRVVQELLGHAHLSSTAIYLRLAGITRLREAMEGIDYLPDAA